MSNFSIIGTPLYQWEIGRKLQVVPLSGMRVDSVHFSNYGDSTALVVKPKEKDGVYIVDIPNILLCDDKNIVVYSVNVSEDKTETLRECVFAVRKRAKPSDYIYTETEVLSYVSLEKRISELEENGTGGKITVDQTYNPESEKPQSGKAVAEAIESIGKGSNGNDGFSPIANVTQTDDGATITITDKNGTTTATIKNGGKGADGQDGIDGTNGVDGIGITDAIINADNELVLTFSNNTEKNLGVVVGSNGQDGENGKDGTNGIDGKDGTSITITNITESTEDGGSNVVTFSNGTSITVKNGSKGADGVNGTNGKDGIDGQNGQDGADGETPYIKNGNWWIGETDTGVKAQGIDGKNGVDGANGKDGQNGKDGTNGQDGVSATHSWNGTVLTVSSASGTSSANLKGDKGDQGIQGIQGEKGETGADGKDGTNGIDGVSPTISVSTITGGHRITITDKKGTKNVDVLDGNDGKDGSNGTNGRGIKSITRTSGSGAAGTTDTYTITYTDNTTSTFTVYNGKNGTNGTNGKDGTSVTVSNVSESTASGGSNVVTFSDGKTLTIKNGINGTNGTNGTNGKDGADGKTPVKGTDYYTAADKTEMVNAVISALPKYAGGVS